MGSSGMKGVRCAHTLANNDPCPSAIIKGSRYCGGHRHKRVHDTLSDLNAAPTVTAPLRLPQLNRPYQDLEPEELQALGHYIAHQLAEASNQPKAA